MSDRPPELACMPSWADATPPWPGSWCRACRGTRWWTERHGSGGWRCMTCHPPAPCRPRRSVARASQTTPPCLPPVRRIAMRIRCSGRRASGWTTKADALGAAQGGRGGVKEREPRVTDNSYADCRFMISVTACVASIGLLGRDDARRARHQHAELRQRDCQHGRDRCRDYHAVSREAMVAPIGRC